jgi:hypothetical protein
MLGDASALFGAGVQTYGYGGIDAMAETCEFISADGARGADVITYTPASLGTVTAQAQMQTILTAWDADTATPLATLEGLGDEAQMATDLPGYQTQIAIRKGGTLVLIAARSGDNTMTSEALARRMASAVAATLRTPE